MLNIPMPGAPGDSMMKGFESMSGQMARLLAAKIQREQMTQQQNQFGQTFGLQQAQEDRLAALSPYQQRLLMAQTNSAEEEARQLAQQRQFIQSLFGTQPPSVMPETPPAQSIPNPNGGEASQKWSMVPPTAQSTAQPSNQSSRSPGMLSGALANMSNLAQNPLLAGYIKHATKGAIDLTAETPAMKSNREFQDFTRKEQYKLDQPRATLTPAMQSQIQEDIYNIQNLKPDLIELRNMEPQTYTYFQNNKDKAFASKILHNAESLVKARKMPNSNESIKKMEKSLDIGIGEDINAWRARIDHLLADLDKREQHGHNILEGKKVSKSKTYEELQKEYEASSSNKTNVTRVYNPKTGKFE